MRSDDLVNVGFFMEYTISKIEKINERIPDEDFKVALPVGTNFSDRRSPKGIWFRIGDRPVPEDLRDLIIEPKR
jgi:hypothetical protein